MNNQIKSDSESPVPMLDKPVEDDGSSVRKIAISTLVASILVTMAAVGLKEFFSFEVRRVEYEQRLSVPDSRLIKQQEMDKLLLAGGEDPVTGKKGLPIEQAIELVRDNPKLLGPIEAETKTQQKK